MRFIIAFAPGGEGPVIAFWSAVRHGLNGLLFYNVLKVTSLALIFLLHMFPGEASDLTKWLIFVSAFIAVGTIWYFSESITYLKYALFTIAGIIFLFAMYHHTGQWVSTDLPACNAPQFTECVTPISPKRDPKLLIILGCLAFVTVILIAVQVTKSKKGKTK